MPSTFFGVEIGRRGLQAHQLSLEVTSHNMTNANTEGYSRQIANITATAPYTYPGFNKTTLGQLGTGVDVYSVTRVRDELIDQRINQETSTLGRWQSRQDSLSEMEQVINEPSDSNIRNSVDLFWKSLEELSMNPTQNSLRSNLLANAETMSDQIRHNYSQLQDIRNNVNEQIKASVQEINTLAGQIAELNDQIGKVVPLGDNPNDLLDQRSVYLEKLANIIDFNYYTDKENRVTITIGGRPLVMGDKLCSIEARRDPSNDNMVQLYWIDNKYSTDYKVEFNSGTLHGLMEIRDKDIPNVCNSLNMFASTMIKEMNALHRQGYGIDENTTTGLDFFTGTGADDININDAIVNDLNKIAASKTGSPGNGDIALAMAQVKHQTIYNDGTTTMGDFIGAFVAKLGTDSQQAQTQTESQNALIGNLNNRRESVSGVSYDEEMTNMIKFQQGYNAAAKIVTTMNEMLDVIVNGLKVS